MAAIEALANHRPYFTARVSEALLKSFLTEPNRAGSTLTNRERDVVQLVAEGHSNKQTAIMLNISLKTVETHPRPSCASSISHHPPISCAMRSATSS